MHTYTAESAKRVRVERGGVWGLFTENGVWLEGAIRSADPTFCRWVASAHAMAWRAAQTPVKTKQTRKRARA